MLVGVSQNPKKCFRLPQGVSRREKSSKASSFELIAQIIGTFASGFETGELCKPLIIEPSPSYDCALGMKEVSGR